MAVTYEVTYSDGRKVLAVASPRVEVAVEQEFFKLREGRWLEWIYRLSWQALTFAGQESRSFDDFLADVADINPQQEVAAEADPTRRAPRPNGSSPSVPALASASPSSEPAPGE